MNTHSDNRRPLSWQLIIGLSSLVLLWPVTALWPILGEGPARAFVLLGLTGAVWIGVVGFARVARPVLTLTICGAAHGFLGLVLGGVGAVSQGPAMLMALVPTLAMGAGVGALTGLAAAGIQRLRGDGGAR